ncbi:Conserved exported protein of unknown function [Mycobacterium canettii CIPT 140070010]|nr:Conserved exported protein of unknown function [Mycobacterium canettii CIPT 140070010]
MVNASASARAAIRSFGVRAGAALTACSSITAPLTKAATPSAWLSPWVCIWTARAASLYTSHNFWWAAAVSAAVYVGVAVVAGGVAEPLVVGRVSATISAAAPNATATIAMLATVANGQLRECAGAGG